MTLAIALIVCGLLGIAWGLPAMHRIRKPFDILAAITVLAGVVSSLIGALIISVPGFFNR
jgi:hypothetical protein